MKKEDIVKLASKYQAKADKDFSDNQNSEIKQYLHSHHRNEDLAVALRMAVNAAEEHQAYIALKIKMAEFMQRAQRIESTSIEFEKKHNDQIAYWGYITVNANLKLYENAEEIL